jgi:hypothetical protein
MGVGMFVWWGVDKVGIRGKTERVVFLPLGALDGQQLEWGS